MGPASSSSRSGGAWSTTSWTSATASPRAGFVALAPDLYHGQKVPPGEPDEAGKAMMAMRLDQAGRDMSGAIDELLRRSSSEHVGVIGFCMGGGLALVLATQRPDAVSAVVPCYGIIPWPDVQPDYGALEAAVLGHYAEKDDFFTPEAANALGEQLRNLGKSVEIIIYPGADHAFFNDTRPEVYDADAAQRSVGAFVGVLPPARALSGRALTARPCGPGRSLRDRSARSFVSLWGMSARSRDLPRRSCLSTPGSNEKFLAKAPTVPADMTFLDLEDAVAPLEKEAARPKVVDAIKNLSWDDRVLCVRVNAWDTEWTYSDVIEVVGNAGERLDELMLPKVQSAAEVQALDLLLTQVEKTSGLPVGHIGIEAQIETARGLINVDEICAASPRLETIIFGPADFAASIEMPVLTGGIDIPEYPGDHFNYVFSRILMAGRANGLQVIDGPFLKVRELDALRDYSLRTRMLGYDGKWALTPDQVTVLNEVYSPTQEQFDRAFDILEAYRKATDEDRTGAVMFGDEMIDEASRKIALKFVSRGERAGLSRSAS